MKKETLYKTLYLILTISLFVLICVIGFLCMSFLDYVFSINAYIVLIYNILLFVLALFVTQTVMNSKGVIGWIENM